MPVTTTGSKLRRFDYRYDGKQKLLATGPYPIVSLVGAHAKRDGAKRLLAADIDPSVERNAERRYRKVRREAGERCRGVRTLAGNAAQRATTPGRPRLLLS